jgi:hypothetical protein
MSSRTSKLPTGISARPRGAYVLYSFGALWMVVVGLAVAAISAKDASAYGVIFGVFMTALAVFGSALFALEVSHARRQPGPSVGRGREGTPATVMARARWATHFSIVVLVLLAGSSLAAAVAALVQHDRPAGVLLLLFCAWMASYLPMLVRRPAHPDGLYLTPAGLTSQRDGAWWHLPWDAVVSVAWGEPLGVRVRSEADIMRGGRIRRLWHRDLRTRGGVLSMQTRYLAADASVIGFLILSYRDRPDLRRQLGTPASLDWEILRNTS